MAKKINSNDKILKMTDLYEKIDYHLDKKETVFNNPEKYGFIEVAMVDSSDIEMITIQRDAVEYIIVGYTGIPKTLFSYDKINKTIIPIPNTDNIVVVYNKYQEEETIKNGIRKPLISIEENDIKIYSRCIICRLSDDGKLTSITHKDVKQVIMYLAK